MVPVVRETQSGEAARDLMELLAAESSSTDPVEDDLKPPDGGKGRVLTAKTFDLKQQSSKDKHHSSSADDLQVTMPSGEIKRPLYIRLADVKLIMPLEVRNAMVGVYKHMLSAFMGPPRSATSRGERLKDVLPPENIQESSQGLNAACKISVYMGGAVVYCWETMHTMHRHSSMSQ